MLALLRTYLRPYTPFVAAILVVQLLQAVGQLALPSLNADIINNGVVTGDTGHILSAGVLMLGVTALAGLAAVAGSYFGALTAMSAGRDLRRDLFARVQSFSAREVNRFGAPSLITRNTNDVQQVQLFLVTALTMMIMAPVTLVGGIVMAVRENATLSWLVVVVVPLMVLVVGLVMRRAIPLFRGVQQRIDRVNQVLRDTLTGIRVVRAFVRTRVEEERFADASRELADVTLAVTRLLAFTMPALMFVMNASSVAIIWFGGQLVNDGSMRIGSLTAFLSYMMQILFSVLMAVMTIAMVPRAAASADRVREVLETEPAIHDPAAPVVVPPSAAAEIAFRDVEFRYPGADEPVLRGVTVTFRAGETTAIVGSTGSGKSTLVNLVPRLQDVTGGAVLMDGVDVREYARADLWSRQGIVPQKAFLFSGTVADNLRYGKEDATDDELWAALDTAQAREVVEELTGGLDARVEQGGTNLSGGQRQRLAIARALVRRPAVYVFDDSFSALDYATDARLRAALPRHTGGATVIVVAQRISTARACDRVVVLDEGRVVGVGTHDELLAGCPTYAEIAASQIEATEAA